MTKDVALIVGVGPGLGAALARRFAGGGLAIAVAARRVDALSELAREIGGRAYTCDATDETSVDQLFAAVGRDLGRPAVAVYNAGAFSPGSVLEINGAEFERCWRALCLGGFLVGQRAARTMVEAGRGRFFSPGRRHPCGWRAVRQPGGRQIRPARTGAIHGARAGAERGSCRPYRHRRSDPLGAVCRAGEAAAPGWDARPRRHCRSLLAPPHATAERLDAGDRPQALGREVLAR